MYEDLPSIARSPLMMAYASNLAQQQAPKKKPALYSRLFDAFSPQPDDPNLGEKQKVALFRQGLMNFAAGMLQPSGGDFGASLSNGLVAGLGSMNQGADNYLTNRYKWEKMRNGGEDPSGYRQFALMAKAAGLEPGTTEYKRAAQVALGTEGRASNAGYSQIKFTDSEGRERIGVVNGRTGQIDLPDGSSFNPNTGAISAQQQAPTRNDMEADISLANDMVKAGIPPEQIDAFLASRGNRANTAPVPASSSVFVGRRKEDEAAAVADAEQRAKLQYAPAFANVDVQAAGDKVRSEAAAQQDVSVGKRAFAANDSVDLLDRAEKLLPLATGSRVGQAYDATAGFFGVSSQGAQANAQLSALAGQLVAKMPRMEGPQSDRDVQMYKEMAGDLANPAVPVQTRLAALRTIRELQRKYANQAPASAPRQQPQRAPSKPGGWSIQKVP